MNLGMILDFFFYLVTMTDTSKSSATKYSKTAAIYTGAPTPTLSAYLPLFNILAILPTGKVNPALADLELYLDLDAFPFAFPFPPLVIL